MLIRVRGGRWRYSDRTVLVVATRGAHRDGAGATRTRELWHAAVAFPYYPGGYPPCSAMFDARRRQG
jgi:hypothetical protein